MKLRIEESLCLSPLTGAKLRRVAFIAESAAAIYGAAYVEGYGIAAAAQNLDGYALRMYHKIEAALIAALPLVETYMFAAPDSEEAHAAWWTLKKHVSALPEV